MAAVDHGYAMLAFWPHAVEHVYSRKNASARPMPEGHVIPLVFAKVGVDQFAFEDLPIMRQPSPSQNSTVGARRQKMFLIVILVFALVPIAINANDAEAFHVEESHSRISDELQNVAAVDSGRRQIGAVRD